jgi:putative glutamine amidotransferase
MKIGLTFTGGTDKHSYYKRWLRQNEGVKVVRLAAEDKNGHLLEQCDGLLLSGGVDIHPRFYNGSLQYDRSPKEGWQPERDEFEIALFNRAQQRQLPVLAICRGLQLVNVIAGGNLAQDLGKTLDKVHESIDASKDRRHTIQVEPHTLLHELVKEGSGEVNSAHHQAINVLGEALRVNARAEDGTIEGIEWADRTGKPFLLGVQWHPERMSRLELQHTPASQKIIERFIEEIKKSKAGKP